MKILASVVVCVLAVPAFAQNQSQNSDRVSCASSHGGGRQFCQADTHNGVLLIRERSQGVCRQGSTWDYNRDGITVSGGCDAEFLVAGTGRNGNQTRNNQGQNGGSNGGHGYGNVPNGNGGSQGNQSYGQNNQNYNQNHQNNGNSSQNYTPTLPAGTQMQVRLEQAVDPSTAKAGDTLQATLVNDLTINGQTVAGAGAPVNLKVTSNRNGQTYPLTVQLASLETQGGRYKLTSSSVHSARDSQSGQTANNNGNSNGFGAVLGNILNATTASQLPAGSVYTFRLVAQSRPTQTNTGQGSR